MKPLPPKHLAGDKLTHLTIMKYLGRGSIKGKTDHIYLVKCDCGEVVHRSQFHLYTRIRSGFKNHCGCKAKGTIDYEVDFEGDTQQPPDPVAIGQRYNGATVVSETRIIKGSRNRPGYLLRCDCGEEFTKDAAGTRSAVNLNNKLRCQTCHVEERQRKAEEKRLESLQTVTEEEPWDTVKQRLKALQDWGYAPR
ncbi:MAG: hypothetical protein H7842_02400 [Gammaproteobacteria bacterium SHHR-1]